MFVIGNLLDALASMLDVVLQTLLLIVILVNALLSWVRPDPGNPIVHVPGPGLGPGLRSDPAAVPDRGLRDRLRAVHRDAGDLVPADVPGAARCATSRCGWGDARGSRCACSRARGATALRGLARGRHAEARGDGAARGRAREPGGESRCSREALGVQRAAGAVVRGASLARARWSKWTGSSAARSSARIEPRSPRRAGERGE